VHLSSKTNCYLYLGVTKLPLELKSFSTEKGTEQNQEQKSLLLNTTKTRDYTNKIATDLPSEDCQNLIVQMHQLDFTNLHTLQII
jgi:hypothetical protein